MHFHVSDTHEFFAPGFSVGLPLYEQVHLLFCGLFCHSSGVFNLPLFEYSLLLALMSPDLLLPFAELRPNPVFDCQLHPALMHLVLILTLLLLSLFLLPGELLHSESLFLDSLDFLLMLARLLFPKLLLFTIL